MNSPEQKIEEAHKAISSENYNEAIKIYGEILDSECDDLTYFTVYQDLGFLFYEHKKFDDALFYLNSALNLDLEKNLANIHRIIGFTHLQKGDFELAVESLEEAIFQIEEKKEEYYFAVFELAKALFELNEHERSLNYFQEVEGFFKGVNSAYYSTVLYFEGLIRFMQKEIDIAATYFKEIVESAAQDDKQKNNGFFGLMFIANVNKDGDELINLAGKILSADPNFYDKETLTFFSLKAYQYQNRELEYEHMLDLFINDYPKGKYSDQYDELNNYEFKKHID